MKTQTTKPNASKIESNYNTKLNTIFGDSKMYSPATRRNPSPKTMLIKTMKCVNTQQWFKKTNKVLEFQITKNSKVMYMLES
jgi:hypothetical protein